MKNITQELSRQVLFSRLPKPVLEELSKNASWICYKKGEVIFLEGELSDCVFVVLCGIVKLYKSSYEGRDQVLGYFEDGMLLNFVPAMLDYEPKFEANAKAITQLELIKIPMQPFLGLLKENNELSLVVLHMLALRLRSMTQLLADLGFRSVRSRLARFLIRQADDPNKRFSLTQDEIASAVGTVRDVIGRYLREFEDLGYLKRDRQKIILLQRNALENIAETKITE